MSYISNTADIKTTQNRRLAKKLAQCLYQALCFVSCSVLADSWGPTDIDSISVEEIRFGKTLYMRGKEAIMIYFSERIVGAIDKKSGRCEILGQD